MDYQIRLAEIAKAYQNSVVLLTAARVGIFEALAEKPLPADAVAQTLRLDARAVETVLLVLVADGFLEQANQGFRLVEGYAPFLTAKGSRTQTSIMRHQYNCLKRWCELEEVLRTGKPVPRQEEGPEELRAFICGMADISRFSSVEVAEKADIARYRKMIDVGGGPATSSITFARHNPALRCVVFDLAEPIEIAKEEIRKAGLEDRIETRVGDYFQDELGEGFDLAYVSNIIHSLGTEETRMLFGKCFRALEKGGDIIVKDFFLDDSRAAPAFAALFSINMLVGTENGRSYTLNETRRMLEETGFSDFQTVEVAAASGLIIARKK